MPDLTFVWENPPAVYIQRYTGATKETLTVREALPLSQWVRVLQAQPDRWARLGVFRQRQSAHHAAVRLRRLAPPDLIETAVRAAREGYSLYARAQRP